MSTYKTIEGGVVPIKAWVEGVPVDPKAEDQLRNIAQMPFVHKHVAVMPDVHFGIGATVGSVIATKGAIIPAAVGVDIGCGMMAIQTTLKAHQLPDNLSRIRGDIERTVPHGFSRKHGGWKWGDLPDGIGETWVDTGLADGLKKLEEKHPKIKGANSSVHLGTLGSGNHFIEICLDEADTVWIMLHTGSRGVGNQIGRYFIAEAKEVLGRKVLGHAMPDKDLAFYTEGEDDLFDDYIEAVLWAQTFARTNREVMMARLLKSLKGHLPKFKVMKEAVNCHHNYVERENHFGDDVWVTRKGAVRAGEGELGIIPGSMGAKSYIVRGKGNPDSFCSCSHGAGRVLSRTAAKETFTLADHREATKGVECRKDRGVIDETPGAYKDIDAVMAAQSDLVEVVHTLKQVVCVKG